MAKQDINLGTQPTGVGGDTNRSANIKTNANLKEIYTALGGSVSGGNGSVLPSSLPIGKGGTGATTVAAARTNLGLGNAALGTLTTSDDDSAYGRVMRIGNLGIGTSADGLNQMPTKTLPLSTGLHPNGQYLRITGGDATGHGAGVGAVVGINSGTYLGQYLQFGSTGNAHLMVYPMNVQHNIYHGTLTINDGSSTVKRLFKLLDEQNTTKDSNGFVKSASPIVSLYADHIELNDEAKQQAITFGKLGVGDYLIKGSSGLAQEGWYVEQPKDANGNVFHAVVYDTLANGDISVKTYEQKMDGVRIVADLDKPVDVKENRFISIRLQELPQPESEEPQPDPTITDYQGNPAPSHLHELVDGTWTISSENAEILENERLSAMPALTRRQFRLALVLNGYNLADIETLINSIEDPMQRQITMIEWQDATTFHRTNPSLIVMAGLMGLDAETVDQLWLQASTL